MTRFYIEVCSFSGRWCPRVLNARPIIKNGRLGGQDKAPLRVRALAEVKPEHRHQNLTALQAIYAPAGDYEEMDDE